MDKQDKVLVMGILENVANDLGHKSEVIETYTSYNREELVPTLAIEDGANFTRILGEAIIRHSEYTGLITTFMLEVKAHTGFDRTLYK